MKHWVAACHSVDFPGQIGTRQSYVLDSVVPVHYRRVLCDASKGEAVRGGKCETAKTHLAPVFSTSFRVVSDLIGVRVVAVVAV